MTNQEAIKILKNTAFLAYQPEPIEVIEEAVNKAISALQEQEVKTQLSREDTTSKVKKTCITCKHYPPESKWPCIDCDMRNPADRWEPQELSKNSAELEKKNGDLQPTCNNLATDTISRQAAIDVLCTENCHEEGRWCDDGDCSAVRRLKALPSAQPDIVKCKDCMHYGAYYRGNESKPVITYLCKWCLDRTMEPDDFCSRAERRTND